MNLWQKIILAMTLGLILGLMFGDQTAFLQPVGKLFLNLINMVVTLIVFTSITVGITGIGNSKKLGRIGLKTVLFYLANTLLAIALGLFIAKVSALGTLIHLHTETTHSIDQMPSIGTLLLTLIPSNPVRALVDGNIMQIILFSVFFGYAINLAGEKGKPLKSVIHSASDVMFTLTAMIMEFSPIGVFAIMAWVAGSFGLSALVPLAKFLSFYYIACLIQFTVVFAGSLRYIAKVPIRPFLDAMREPAMVAFGTCSSAAALPISMKCVEEKLGVSRNITSFVLPLGSTINMAGAAIFQAMSAIFIANAYRIELEFSQILTLVVSAVLSAVGAAGVPGTGFIMLSAVLSSAGLPVEGLVLLAGIDRLREMVSTVINCLGDAIVAIVIAKQENEIDLSLYNTKTPSLSQVAV